MTVNATFAAAVRLFHSTPTAPTDDGHDAARPEGPAPAPAQGVSSNGLAALRDAYVDKPVVTATSTDQASDAEAARREEEARKLNEEGGLRSPGPNPPASQQELDALAARIGAADDDAAVAIARDPRAMALATPQQKAALIRALMDGHTNSDEEAAIKQILLSCKSREEMDQVIQMSGGIQAIADELDTDDLQAISNYAISLTQKQDVAVERAVWLLEQAQSPAEFERLYEELGGEQLKHRLSRPGAGSKQTQKAYLDTLRRLEALGEKYGVAGVGFGLAPEKTAALQGAIQKAIDDGDNDAIVKLAENSDAMKAASPVQKARMIAILQEGWTKDSQDMAIARILTSCATKAEFDRVVDMAGGPQVLEDVDYAEAKADINKLMGGFDRIDCADDKATASAYRGALMPPAVDELARTRAPSDAELRDVLGPDGVPASGSDPALADARQRLDAVRVKMGKAAHDLQADPMARNKLALTNRERQLNGQPPLDYTSLVTQAYKAATDPSFAADVDRAIFEAQKELGPLDDEKKQEIRADVLAQRLGGLAKQYGLSEQAMKTLVTAKMGRVLQEGAGAVSEAAGEAVRSLQSQLVEIEQAKGAKSPEAEKVREAIRKFAPAVQGWANRLQAAGATAASLFKVPPSFAEDFVKAISVVGDVLAAVVNVIPGVGQAISGAYFGVKAIVAAATGDVFGAFKSLLSAVPGFSGVFGAASAAINTGAKVVQAGVAAGEGFAGGNPLAFAGALGGLGGTLGVDFGKFVPGGDAVQSAIQHGRAIGGVIDGVARGDVNAALSGLGGLTGANLGVNLPDVLRKAGGDVLAGALDTLGASPAAQGFRETLGYVTRFVDAAGRNDAQGVGDVLQQWMPDLAARTASKSIARLADQAKQLLKSQALVDARKRLPLAALEVQRQLERMTALKASAADMRRFEEAAVELRNRCHEDWHSVGADLLRRFGLR